jgi:hypothetical protein
VAPFFFFSSPVTDEWAQIKQRLPLYRAPAPPTEATARSQIPALGIQISPRAQKQQPGHFSCIYTAVPRGNFNFNF